MTRCTISPAALDDLDDIDEYVAANSPPAAQRVMDAIFETFNTLAARPGIGHQRPDLTSRRVRFWTVLGRYMIVYREQPDGIEIVRGLAAGRDVTTVLKG